MSVVNTQQLEFAVSPFGEVYLPSINRQQFEARESSKVFNDKYNDLLNDGYLNIVVGTDSGLLANYVLENADLQNSRFIFVELDSVLQTLNIEIPQDYQSELRIIQHEELATVLEEDCNSIYILKNKLRLYESQGAKKSYCDAYQSLKTVSNNIADKAVFDVSVNLNQKNFVHKQLINLCDNLHPVSQLKGRFTKQNCIVVGGGPSLDTHLDWLRENQASLYTIAVSRAAHQLQQAGVQVDFVVSVDPQGVSFTVSKEMLELPESTIFINADHAVPSLVGQWRGAQFYTGSRVPWESDNNIETAGPTVSNAAIWTAGNLGFKNIFLLGVDMCWSPQGVSHASGSLEGKMGPDISKIGVWVDTNSGHKAETTAQLAEAMKSLQQQTERLKDTQVINLSEFAAQISGISYLSPAEISLTPEVDKQAVLADIRGSFQHRADKEQLIQLKTQISSVNKKYGLVEKLAEKALSYAQQLPATEDKLNLLEQELTTKYPAQMKFMKFYGYADFSRFLSTRNAEHWDQTEITTMYQDYYQAMKNVAKSIQASLGDAIKHIEVRVEEQRTKPDATLLLKDWIRFNQPRRLDMVTAANPDWLDGFTEEQQQLLAELKQIEESSKQETLRHKFTNEKLTSWGLEMVPQKIHALVETENRVGLTQLINALDTYQTSEESKVLSARAKSHLHQLEGDFQSAFNVLAELPDSWRGELENKQMVLMALNTGQLDAAEQGLRTLTPLSDEYLPQLAQVLKIKKDYPASLETWLEYLNKHPSDSSSWCRLGEMLLQLEQYQDALTVYQQALQADPDNRLAEQYVTELSRALAQQ